MAGTVTAEAWGGPFDGREVAFAVELGVVSVYRDHRGATVTSQKPVPLSWHLLGYMWLSDPNRLTWVQV